MIKPYYQKVNNSLKIHLKVIPNSIKNEFCGVIKDVNNQELLKLKVTAVAEDGKANKEVIKFIAKALRITQGDIEIISGITSRKKVLLLKNVDKPPC